MPEATAEQKLELHKYLDPKVLSKITRLDLRARHVVEGFINGLHRSPFHGYSVEFATHREYAPGDDIKHIDWKVQARTDRFYIKQYEEETNLRATFLVDASESMHFSSHKQGLSKYEYACATAASLSFLLQQQQDAVGLGVFDETLLTHLPASNSQQQLKAMVHAMHIVKPQKKTSLEPIAHAMAEKMTRRGMICLISDLFVDIEGVVRALEHFRHRGHEVMVLHIMDPAELEFPYQGTTRFRGMEAMGELTLEPRALREAYLAEVKAFCHEIKRKCVAGRMDYKLLSTADHLDAGLSAFLAARAAAVRKTSAKR